MAIQINASDICFVLCLPFLILQLSSLIPVILHLWPVMLLVSVAQFLHRCSLCQTSRPKDQSHSTKSHPALFNCLGSTRPDVCLGDPPLLASLDFWVAVGFLLLQKIKTNHCRNEIQCHVCIKTMSLFLERYPKSVKVHRGFDAILAIELHSMSGLDCQIRPRAKTMDNTLSSYSWSTVPIPL